MVRVRFITLMDEAGHTKRVGSSLAQIVQQDVMSLTSSTGKGKPQI